MISKEQIVLMSIEEELENQEQVSRASTGMRHTVRSVLKEAVDLVKFNEDDIRDPKATSAMLSVLKAYTDNAKDEEVSAARRVSTKLRLKEVNNNEQQNEAVQSLIMAVTSKDTTDDIVDAPPIDAVDIDLSPDLEASIDDTELREDPDDISF